ncbi:MAG: MMPL family transporter, partial [Microbacteriaceae bacterium]
YMIVLLLSWRQGYRLSLAGVAGLIVAIGITADSFIVYFERIRDELRDGRMLESAVEAGWKRAIRTVLASDTINFLAACVLFIVAVGNVKGFALTLGLTTVVDVVVVALFTHPMLQLIARTRFFSEGHRFSGLDPTALGAVYRGRAQFRSPVGVPVAKQASVSREAAKRQTIAERKAADQGSSHRDGKDA